MNIHSPSLPGRRRRVPGWAAAAACGWIAWGVPGPVPGGPPASVYQRGVDAEEAGRGERLVAAAIASLGKAESVTARIRQLARFGDTVLKGGGRYVQSGTGQEQRFRLESRLSAVEGEETFDLIEVCDGLFFWSYRKLGTQPASVQRVDVQRVHEHLEKLQAGPRPSDGPHLGGIQRMLLLVRQWFRFTTATAGELDGMPVWTVEGTWSRPVLAALLPAQAEAINGPAGITAADLPDGMPWSVRISIGTRELFPFRIEWLAIPGTRPVAATTPEVVAVFELYDVRIGDPVDATAFVYKPAMEGLIDVTDQHLREVTAPRP